MRTLSFAFIIFLITWNTSYAQQSNIYPRLSQMVKVFQRIGTTDLEVIYHAPLAKGRNIFGEVVIFNEKNRSLPQPWRAGANENTVIKFSHDVSINGKPLKAGSYGLHIFVSERAWEVTFSNDYLSWGSFSYKAENDALRVSVMPNDADYQEWLSYRFIKPQSHAANLELQWADKQIEFEISTNVNANIIADVEKMEEKTWSALLAAANCALDLGSTNLDKAMELVNASLALESHLENRFLKVKILQIKGQKKEANLLKQEAVDTAEAEELFRHAMDLNNRGEDKEALRILDLNAKKNPVNWNTYRGYAFYYSKRKDPKAIRYFEKALKYAPDTVKSFVEYQLALAKSKLSEL